MDIAPELLDKIERQFYDTVNYGMEIGKLQMKIIDGVATYKEAEEYAVKVGEALAQSFRDNLSSDILPDGKMYYNIADRVVRAPMEDLHEIVAEAAAQVQQSLNEAAGIRIKPQIPEVDTDRINGIINRVSSEDHFDDVSWILDDPVVNFSQNVVDQSIRKNADFHSKSGFAPKIVRTAEASACAWCQALAGSYNYEEVKGQGNEVWRRHENCRCIIEYVPGRNRREIVDNYRGFSREGRDERIKRAEIQAIETERFHVPRSVGAMWKRFYVENPIQIKNSNLYIKPGTDVTGIKVTHSGTEIRDVNRLVHEYPLQNGRLTKAQDWYKVRGRAIITDGNGYEESREVHWYQAKDIGKKEFKFPKNEKQR